jgi:methylmalonyl-CoA/ethylmalonyl-CoA epimerase
VISHGVAYVALVVSDVARVADALARDFGLTRSDVTAGRPGRTVPLFAVGRSALALFEPNDPFVGDEARPGVHHIALEVANVASAAGHVTAAGVALADQRPSAGLGGAYRLMLSPKATAGVRTYLTEPVMSGSARAGAASLTPAPVERLDHIGVASADNATALDVFCGRLGCALESTQTDTEVSIALESFTSDRYGVVYHSRAPQPVGGLRIAFVTVGDCELEFLQDMDPALEAEHAAHGPGTTKRDQSAIARYIASRGAGLHHLALKVPDIDGMLARLGAAGHTVIDRVGRPGSRRARIGFLHPRTLGGVLVHLVQREPLADGTRS